MTTRIASTNIQNATIELSNMSAAAIAALSSTTPTITQIQITNSSYVVLDDTAVNTSGGYIKITGTNFTAGSQVVIGSVTATSVGFVNSTTLNVQVPAQAAGTYIVYLTTNTGSVAILVNGLTYSGAPTWVTGSTLDNGNQGSPLSIQLSATGDAPITYTLAAGSSLPPGLTLSSGGLISGTVTGLSVQTLYNFTVNAIDAQLQDSPRAFTITILVNDPQFPYVSLLLSASNPSSTFVSDASTNNFAISLIGDTRPNDVSPLTPGYYNNYFGGSNYWTLPGSSNYNYGSGDFTIESWVYPISTATAASETYMPIVGAVGSFSPGQNNWTFLYAVTGGNRLVFSTYEGGVNYGVNSNSFTPTFNVWQHWAVVRSSGTITFYVNGVSIGGGSFTRNQNFGSLGIAVASMWGGGTPFTVYWGPTLYLSNLRFVVGTAVYTSNFTPSTTPLTAIANTQLLTCQSNRFIDNSTNNATFSFQGTNPISSFNPFVPNSSYSTYGSGYFDGTGDYAAISTTANTILTGNSNFTLELWAYVTGTPATYNSFFGGATNDFTFAFTTNGSWGIYVAKIGLAPFITTGMSAYNELFNRWNHLAVTKSGNNWNIWVNGVSRAAVTDATTFTNSQKTIGSENGVSLMQGYISNIRYTSAVLYTATFTPPTSPLTAGANTQLLTLQNNQPTNNSMFIDNSTNNFLITRTGNATQGAFTPYIGTWSNYFDGNGDYLSVSSNAAFALPGNFTVEAWVYIAANSNADGSGFRTATIVSTKQSGPTDGFEFQISGNGSTTGTGLSAEIRVGGNNLGYGVTATIPQTTWNHIAFVRSGTTLTYYLNGISLGSSTVSQNIPAGTLTIGGQTVASYERYVNGYISNLRIVKGTAVYTGNFTPATSPLTPITGTSILTCADGRFVDDSMNNFTVTRVGDTSVQRFSPFSPQLQQTPTSYSVYFDGTGDYLSAAVNTTSTSMSTGDCTLEAWVYLSAISGTQCVFSTLPTTAAATYTGYAILINSSGYIVVDNWNPNEQFITATSNPLSANQWYHIAYTRSSGTNRIFVNGVLCTTTGTMTQGLDNAQTALTIGYQLTTGYNFPVTGYISNFRIVKGTAVYTANFTPSTTPLTAISGTSLLTCQSTTIIDNSTNNFTITVNGDSKPLPQNPFGYTNPAPGPYVPTTYGGSAYFDGNGDNLNIASNTLLNWGTSNFTIEFWAYDDGSSLLYPGILSTVTGWSAGSISIRYNNTGQANKFSVHWNPAGDPFLTSSSTWPSRAWHHVALTRSGNTFTLYVNGFIQATGTSSNNWDLSYGGTVVGWSQWDAAQGYYKGYVSDLRLIRGQVLYTGPFVPPAAPLTALQNTIMLLNNNNAGIYDSSMMADYETVGDARINTTVKKYGNSSISFDGTGDYLVCGPVPANYVFGTGDFTMEMWIYASTVSPTYQGIWDSRTADPSVTPHLTLASGAPTWWVSGAARITGSTLVVNTWYHLAVVRSSGVTKMYLNGTQTGSNYTDSNNYTSRTSPTIGINFDILYPFTGYLDDFRITKGFARYTTTFTPPTSPFLAY